MRVSQQRHSCPVRHVWIFNQYAQTPEDRGGLTRHYSLARHLGRHGWRATVITSSTEHPSGRQRPGSTEARTDDVDGVPFLRLRVPAYQGNGADRIRNMLAYGWRALVSPAIAALDPPDAIVGSSPHPAAALAGAWLARRKRVPFIYEVRDLWPQALIDMGRLSERGLAARAMRRAEAHLFRSAARSIVLWPNVDAYLQERGIDPAREPVWIPNGVDLETLPAPEPLPENPTFTLMYLGAHGGANGLDTAIRAMRILQDRPSGKEIGLRLVGEGPDKEGLRELAASIGARSVTFEDAVEKKRVPQLAAEADAFLFTLIPAPMFRFGISPNKLYEYMAAQRPVIFCCNASYNPVDLAGAGLSTPAGDAESLADTILELASRSVEERTRMAIAGRRHVEEHFDFQKLAGDLAAVLEGSLADNRS